MPEAAHKRGRNAPSLGRCAIRQGFGTIRDTPRDGVGVGHAVVSHLNPEVRLEAGCVSCVRHKSRCVSLLPLGETQIPLCLTGGTRTRSCPLASSTFSCQWNTCLVLCTRNRVRIRPRGYGLPSAQSRWGAPLLRQNRTYSVRRRGWRTGPAEPPRHRPMAINRRCRRDRRRLGILRETYPRQLGS